MPPFNPSQSDFITSVEIGPSEDPQSRSLNPYTTRNHFRSIWGANSIFEQKEAYFEIQSNKAISLIKHGLHLIVLAKKRRRN
jgi:hypothetical protein